jgi:hypothetical protein
MSNSPTNREQNTRIDLTPTQQDPGSAKPTDFEIVKSEVPHATPAHGQHGRTAREERELMLEGENDPGKTKPRAIPDRHKA